MVEENNAEIHGLRQRVDTLSDKIDRFRTGDGDETYQGYDNGMDRYRAA